MTGIGNQIAALRKEFAGKELSIEAVSGDPIQQFEVWFSEAMRAELTEVNAMSLATATKSGIPSVRIVLLKGFDENGFMFYTNYNSRKGSELAENPHAAICFYWSPLDRQVRIRGNVEKVSEEVSDEYFAVRPKGSQIGAWASPQSQVISRETLLENEMRYDREFAEGKVPRPKHWGGYNLIPEEIEFWQGRPNRMHDRILYKKTTEGWKIDRIAP